MDSDPPARGHATRDTRSERLADLRRMLIERRRAMQEEVHRRTLDGRIERPTDVRDEIEQSAPDPCGSSAVALLTIRANTVSRIDDALSRLDAGDYGMCVACDGEIPERQLRALPFAVRCHDCVLKREQEQTHVRQADRRGTLLQFPAARNPERA